MPQGQNRGLAGDREIDPRWKDLYNIGAIASILQLVIVILAVAAFFIWPYAPGFTSTEAVFTAIQNDRLGGLMALDFFLLAGSLVSVVTYLAMYVSLKRVNESLALIALALGLIAVAALIPARPISEIITLSDRYAAATTDAERNLVLAAGESLLALFNGTSWLIYYFLGPISGLISSFLMLRSRFFKKATAYVGLVTSIVACGILLPGLGAILAMLSMLGYMIWNVQLALEFFRLGRQAAASNESR